MKYLRSWTIVYYYIFCALFVHFVSDFVHQNSSGNLLICFLIQILFGSVNVLILLLALPALLIIIFEDVIVINIIVNTNIVGSLKTKYCRDVKVICNLWVSRSLIYIGMSKNQFIFLCLILTYTQKIIQFSLGWDMVVNFECYFIFNVKLLFCDIRDLFLNID